MSRPLHKWIAIKREKRKIDRKARALYLYLVKNLPPWHRNHASIMHIMMRCDFEAYRYLGHTITGLAWAKGSDGVPVALWPAKKLRVSRIRGKSCNRWVIDDPMAEEK